MVLLGRELLQAKEIHQVAGLLLAVAILAALASGVLMGSLNGVILSRTNIPSFIVTLGVSKICETFSRVIANGSTVRVNGNAVNPMNYLR